MHTFLLCKLKDALDIMTLHLCTWKFWIMAPKLTASLTDYIKTTEIEPMKYEYKWWLLEKYQFRFVYYILIIEYISMIWQFEEI